MFSVCFVINKQSAVSHSAEIAFSLSLQPIDCQLNVSLMISLNEAADIGVIQFRRHMYTTFVYDSLKWSI